MLLPQDAFVRGRVDVQVVITDGDDFSATLAFNLLGPVAAASRP